MYKNYKYTCPKCNSRQYEIGEIRTTGSFMMKLFNIQNIKFTTVTCTKCQYTELYKTSSSKFGNVVDFFTN
ncbi:MAG: zinc ribbon domain-containing protein [Bacteroidales bacterium]|nr:zinc ribbon domain-containing protein [Bacteroidales bacterium]